MAWMRMMGGASVEYHRKTVVERGDDYPGRALAYYASRGETPLVWGGSGAARSAWPATVDRRGVRGGLRAGRGPPPGERRAAGDDPRPGLELVISAHKSVAELGVIGRAEDMHQIMDAERDATLGYLDRVTRQMGRPAGRGRRGHADRRADLRPHPPRHLPGRRSLPSRSCAGGQPGRDGRRAGRLEGGRHRAVAGASARRDHGRPGGRRPGGGRSWAMGSRPIRGRQGSSDTGVSPASPTRCIEVHSKRAAEIEAECARRGQTLLPGPGGGGPHHPARPRTTASRPTWSARWRGELADIGWPADRLAAAVDAAAQRSTAGPASDPAARPGRSCPRYWDRTGIWPAGRCSAAATSSWPRPPPVRPGPGVLGGAGRPGAGRPRGHPPGRCGRRPPAGPLAGVCPSHARQPSPRAWPARSTAATPPPPPARGGGQPSRRWRPAWAVACRQSRATAAMAICTSGRGAEIVVGVAGAGQTTMLRVVSAAFEASGYQVIGTATSGQAAQNLGREAELGESANVGQPDLAARPRPTAPRRPQRRPVRRGRHDRRRRPGPPGRPRRGGRGEAGAHRRSPPTGRGRPRRRPASPRRPPPRRGALPDGEPPPARPRRTGQPWPSCATATSAAAVSWYETHDRIHAIENRDDAVQAAVDAWAADIAAGHAGRPVRLAASQCGRPQPAGPGMDGRPPGGCRAPKWSAPAAWPTGPATGSSPWPPARTAAWSPPSGPPSKPSTPAGGV